MTTQPLNTQSLNANSTTNTALVLGITGGYGGAMAAELLRRGWRVRALVRDLKRGEARVRALTSAEPLAENSVTLVAGTLTDAAALARAAAGARVIVHGVNPTYDRWHDTVVPYAQLIADLAVGLQATVLFPGNVYNFAPGTGIDEATPMNPPTSKGALRIEAETVLAASAQRGAQLIVLRGGDFFGAAHSSSWMAHILQKATKPGGSLQMPSEDQVPHQWCFLPDFVATHVDLLEMREALPADARFHFAGHVATGQALSTALRLALDDPKRKITPVPWWLLRMIGWVQPVMREIVSMRYLWTEALVMRQDKLEATLPMVRHTPLVAALRHELGLMGAVSG